ncbi:hypothetical protein MRB53_022243 [Persea americana]|uniref:Uncharacterized protein n=1 Tax=Persea americana TaxID=3435 RepID=A0ACC2L666_PERAE|nr:hypothetical protein MRB53_022243 [Persea americana]
MALSLRLLPSRRCILSSSSSSLPASSVIRRVRVSSSCESGNPSPPPSNAGAGTGDENRDFTDALVQYVVLRRDLIDTWPLGSVVTQGCHASVAAFWSNRDDPLTLDLLQRSQSRLDANISPPILSLKFLSVTFLECSSN